MPQALDEFVWRALDAKVDRDRIRHTLDAAGWPASAVDTSLARYADTSDVPIPVPVPQPAFDARDAFVHGLLFVALAASAWSVGSLAFTLVDWLFPDPAHSWSTEVSRFAVDWDVAILAVCYPTFAALFWATNRDASGSRLSLSRRWLTYLALFVAATTVLGDLATLFYQFLSGSLTTPLAAKLAVVGAIGGGVLAHYLGEAFRGDRHAKAAARLFLGGTALVAVATAVAGLAIVPSPGVQRGMALDSERVSAVSSMQQAIEQYAERHGSLPDKAEDALSESPWARRAVDPATGQPLEYEKGAGLSFKICAVYASPSPSYATGSAYHTAGRHCADFTAPRKPAR